MAIVSEGRPEQQRCSAPIEFTVYGIPIPQGSSRAFIPKGWNRPVITAANSKTKPWRQEVAGACFNAMTSPLFGAIKLEVKFFFPRPKSLKKSTVDKTTKPDIDKLLRAIMDGLTGQAFFDDSQVTEVYASKMFGFPPRAEIRLAGRGD